MFCSSKNVLFANENPTCLKPICVSSNISVSGEVPQEPVVSKASGLLFEKRLIEKAIKDQGKCPVTGEALSVEDLLQVQGNVERTSNISYSCNLSKV